MIMMLSIFTDTTVIRWPALMTMMIRECEAQQMPASVACVHLCYKALGHAQVKKKQFATSPMWSWWWHWCCTPVGHGKSDDWSGWLRTMVGHGWRFVWNLPIIKLNTFLKIRARKLWFMIKGRASQFTRRENWSNVSNLKSKLLSKFWATFYMHCIC